MRLYIICPLGPFPHFSNHLFDLVSITGVLTHSTQSHWVYGCSLPFGQPHLHLRVSAFVALSAWVKSSPATWVIAPTPLSGFFSRFIRALLCPPYANSNISSYLPLSALSPNQPHFLPPVPHCPSL